MRDAVSPPVEPERCGLLPVVTVEEAKERFEALQRFKETVLQSGVDYGEIRGASKPTLFKPGAEKLAEFYGLTITVEVVERMEDWDRGLFHYEVKCRLLSNRNGAVVAEGLGSCNSREARFRYRWVREQDLPEGVARDGLPVRVTGNGSRVYRLENPDPFTLVNTVLKLAKKRAVVDAALSAARASGMFTQDIEDLPEGEVLAYVDHETGEVLEPRAGQREQRRPAARRAQGTADELPALAAQHNAIKTLADKLGMDGDALVAFLHEQHGVMDVTQLTRRQAARAIAELQRAAKGPPVGPKEAAA